MLKRLLLLGLLASPALAEDAPVLAEYWANSGSLPPEYAWETSVSIREDGALLLKHCKGYETEGPACKTRKAKVAPADLEAIRLAAEASGLREAPALAPDAVMVGGAVTGGVVYLDGGKVVLPSDTREEDAARVAAVLRAIEAAIPARLGRFLGD
jgi:hypothetical protein